MRLLLDTHVALWALGQPDEIVPGVQSAILDPSNQVFVSAASVWEVAIKTQLGKLSLDADFGQAISESGFEPVDINYAHASLAGALPAYHRDPFDRMLIAQGLFESFTIVTHDDSFEPYGITILKT